MNSPVIAQPSSFSFEKQGRFLSAGLSASGAPSVGTAYDGPQPFDVLHYKLDLTLSLVTDALQGKCTMTMRLKNAVDTLVLNAVGLSLDTVKVDGVSKTVSFNSSAETFTIHLNGIRNPGDTLRIELAYQRIQGYPRPSSRQGYYFFRDTIGLPVQTNLGYTFAEPSDARFWFPCYDEPWDKASAEINVTVPNGYVAASNGKILGVTQNGNSTRTWRWREDHQIATYLMCVTASAFTISSTNYFTATGDTVPVQYYAWSPDSSSCAAYLPTVRQMIGAFAARFGEYPFDKYGMTAIVPFGYLGMEHQSITTLNRFARTWERVVAHELAHQWWGDLVTCGTWRDIWLNEGFATYSEALWYEHLGGPAGLKAYMKDTLEHFQFSSWAGALYDPVGQGFNLFDDVVYSKGAWVLHTLRGVLGDSVFFRTLRAYRQRWAGGSAITSELKAVVDSMAGQNMSWFFDRWVFGRGWPIYAFQWNWTTDTLSIDILQREADPVFKMPIRMRAAYLVGDTTFVVGDSLRLQTFKVRLPARPNTVDLDPDNWILKQVVPYPLSVDDNETPAGFMLHQNFPNPFSAGGGSAFGGNPTTTIRYSLPSESPIRAKGSLPAGQAGVGSLATLKVFDILGREVATLVQGLQAPGNHTVSFDGSNLASGVYIYSLQVDGLTFSRKMVLAK